MIYWNIKQPIIIRATKLGPRTQPELVVVLAGFLVVVVGILLVVVEGFLVVVVVGFFVEVEVGFVVVVVVGLLVDVEFGSEKRVRPKLIVTKTT